MGNPPSSQHDAWLSEAIRKHINHLGEIHLDMEQTEILIGYLEMLEEGIRKYRKLGETLRSELGLLPEGTQVGK